MLTERTTKTAGDTNLVCGQTRPSYNGAKKMKHNIQSFKQQQLDTNGNGRDSKTHTRTDR